jgi:hypothetical protein
MPSWRPWKAAHLGRTLDDSRAGGCFEMVRLTVPPSAATLGRRRELDGTDVPRMGNVGGVEFTD